MSARRLPPISRLLPFVLVLVGCGGNVATIEDADVVDSAEAAPDAADGGTDGGTCYAMGTPGPAPCSDSADVDCSACPASCVAFGRAGVCQ